MGSEHGPVGVDVTKPSIARVYDFLLGGKDNFAVDREVGRLTLQVAPEAPEHGRAARAFLRRVVRRLAEDAGIDQFLDIGSGLPTQGNVHEIAQGVNEAARVVYVDNDPIVIVHGNALLAKNGNNRVVQADMRDPDAVLGHPDVQGFLDFSRPVGLLMFSILHHIGDDEHPGEIVARYRERLAPGSFLAIAHFHNPGDAHPEAARQAATAEKVFNEHLGTGRWRTHEEILAYFGDFEMVEPGLVPLVEWHAAFGERFDLGILYDTFVGGLARKP